MVDFGTNDTEDEKWVLCADAKDLSDYTAPSLCNGMLGVTFSDKPMQCKLVLVNSTLDNIGNDTDDENLDRLPANVRGIIPAPNHCSIDLQMNDLDESVEPVVSNWRQHLNMRKAVLATNFIFDSRLEVSHQARVLRHLPFNTLMTIQIRALKPAKFTILMPISLHEKLHEIEQYTNKHEWPHTKASLHSIVAKSEAGNVHMCASNTYKIEDGLGHVISEDFSLQNRTIKIDIGLEQGETIAISFFGALTSNFYFEDTKSQSERLALYALLEGADTLIEKHENAWNRLWQGDVEVSGDHEAQRTIRFSLFNIYSAIRSEFPNSIAPMGLTATNYFGHIFWDCETWILPVLTVLQPRLAKAALEFRFNTLEAAKRNAASNGYSGAMYPWEADEQGQEATPVWALTGPFEHHVSAAIGLAFWDYYRVTQDLEWLKTRGVPVLTAVADFWVSRVSLNAEGHYEILNVVGADEYAENVDNNAFTNGAAISVLRAASDASLLVSEKPDPKWRHVADKIVIETLPCGATSNHSSYRGQTIKQADVNLLSFPLQLIKDPIQIQQDLDYYAERTDPNGPAMSHSIYSIISARLGNKQAASKYFAASYLPIQRPPFGVLSEAKNITNPYFVTAAGGLLQSVIFGFGGIHITELGIMARRQCIPSTWSSLKISICNE